MKRCHVIARIVQPHGALGPSQVVVECTVHHMPCANAGVRLCSIGRIEEATEQALEKIENRYRAIGMIGPSDWTPPEKGEE